MKLNKLFIIKDIIRELLWHQQTLWKANSGKEKVKHMILPPTGDPKELTKQDWAARNATSSITYMFCFHTESSVLLSLNCSLYRNLSD